MARVATRVAVAVAAAAAAAAVTTALPVAEVPSTGRQFFKAQLGGIYTRFIAQGNCPARIEHTGFVEPSAGVVNVPFANIRMGGVPCTSAGSMVVVPNTDNTLTGRLSSLLESNEVLNAVYSQLVDSGAQFLVGFETVSRVCGPTTFAAPTVSFFVSEPEAISVPRVAFLRPDFRPYMMVFKTNSDDGIPCTYAKGDRQVDTGTVASGNDNDDDDDDSDDDDGVTAVPVVVPVVTVDGADEASDSDDDDDGDADNNDGADVVVPVVVPVDGGDDDDSDDDDNDDDDDDSAAVTPVPVVVPAGGDDDATDSDDDDDDSSAVTPVPVVVPAGGDGDATDSDDDDDTSAVTPVPVVVPAGGDGDVTDSDDDDDTSAATPVPVIVDGTDDATDGAVDGADGTDSDTSDDEGPEPSDDDDSVCFPASAEVELESGATVTMDKLAVGDSVRVSADAFSRVFMFTHKVAAGSFNFVKLSTASAASLTVTRSHYIYANGKMTAAGAVRVGDKLELVAERKCDIVTAIASVTGTGLYNPQTLHGDIVVNGIRASTYTTAVEPTVASALLAPLRALFRATGLSTSALDAGSARLAALLPSGASAY